MASTLALTAAFTLLLRCTARGSGCARDQYPLGHGKCCKKCPPDNSSMMGRYVHLHHGFSATPNLLQRPEVRRCQIPRCSWIASPIILKRLFDKNSVPFFLSVVVGCRDSCEDSGTRCQLTYHVSYTTWSELERRCTFPDNTLCVPCEEDHYNAGFTEKRCKRCAVCERERGLQEVKPCDRLSNTHCMCLPGYEEVANQASREDDKRCKPCPAGSFSKGGKEKCRPWTNCTAKGLKLLRAGKREKDAICDEQASGPSEPSPTVALPTSFKNKHSTWTTTAPTRFYSISLVIHPKTETTSDKSGIFIVVVVVVVAVMLFVAGGVGLLYFQKAEGKKSQRRPGALSDVPREDGRSSYRIPIQEEQMDHKASLAQN